MDYKNSKFLNIVAGLFLVGFSFFIMKELQAILLPFFMAVIISFLFEPFYEWIKSKKIPSPVALIIVLLVIIVIANISSVFVYTSISSFNAEIPKYIVKGEILLNSLEGFVHKYGLLPEGEKAIDIKNYLNPESIGGILTTLISGVAGLFTNFLLILIYVLFLLTEFGSIRKRIGKAFNTAKAETINVTLSVILKDVRKYLIGKTLINFSHGVAILIVFWLFGLDFALVWALLTFLLAYIPSIGAIIATILPFLTALIQYDNILTPVLLLIIMTVTGFVFGNVIEPKVMGERLNLSPILLIFSLIFWGYLWGVVGMILSVPVMSMIKIVLSKFESTRPIAILMSNEVEDKKAEQMEMNFTEKQ
jgi:AI-2 transport protein TqsA